MRKFAKVLKDHALAGEGLPTYGTNVLQSILSEAGGLPTQNFQLGSFASQAQAS